MSNPVSGQELSKALDALIMQDCPPPLADDDITSVRVKERANCGHQKAMALIKKWEQAGKVEYIGKRQDPESGHNVMAWRLKSQTPSLGSD